MSSCASGEIAFDGNPTDLDRETRISQPYVLTVHATDNGDKPLHDECTVEIFLVDVNDNAPYISYPNVTTDITYLYIVPPSTQSRKARTVKRALRLLTDNRNRTTAIEPKASKKSKSQKTHLKKSIFIGSSDSSQIKQPKKVPITLLKIEASDPDEGEKGRVHFVLAAGNDYNYFRVDAQSGNVTLAIEDESELRAMKRGCHVIQIDVKDMGDIVLESTTWVSARLRLVFIKKSIEPAQTAFFEKWFEHFSEQTYILALVQSIASGHFKVMYSILIIF